MADSRARNSMLILAASSTRQIVNTITYFVSRTVFIYFLGAEYLGLNGLFSNILSLLSLSELGIGAAVSYYLYRPLVDKDIERIKSLMNFYKICYRVIGFSILGIGVCIMPILPYVVNFDQSVPENLYLIYFLYLLNTASSYFLSAYKQTLVAADQRMYKIEKLNVVFIIANTMADVFVLCFFRSYLIYLFLKVVLVCVRNLVIANKIDREYSYLKDKVYAPLSKAEVKIFFGDIGNAALFLMGSTFFNATDNIIISVLLGTVTVGYYSNYFLLLAQFAMVVGLVVKSFSAGIGNVIATEAQEKQYLIFRQLDFVVYVIVAIITAGLFQGFNSFINLWVGSADSGYVLSQTVVLFLCLSFYMDGTTQITNIFKEGSGNFGIGRTLQIVGGIINIILSVLLGRKYGLEGIFAATVLSKFFITLMPFLTSVGKKVFNKNKMVVLGRYFLNLGILLSSILITWFLAQEFHMKGLFSFILECTIAVAVICILIGMAYYRKLEMNFVIDKLKRIIKYQD